MRLDNRTWQRILEFLRQQPDVYVGKESACRTFIEAVLWTQGAASYRMLVQ